MLTFSVNPSVYNIISKIVAEKVEKGGQKMEYLGAYFIALIEQNSKNKDYTNLESFAVTSMRNEELVKIKSEVNLGSREEVEEYGNVINEEDLVDVLAESKYESVNKRLDRDFLLKEWFDFVDYILIEEGVSLPRILQISMFESGVASVRGIQRLVELQSKYSFNELLLAIMEDKTILREALQLD